MAEKETDAKTYAKALTSFVENGKALLELAEQESKEGLLQDYIRKKIRIELDQSLLGLIPAGARLFTRCAELQDAVEDFLQLGVQWDSFLEYLDKELHLGDRIFGQEPQVKCLSPDIPLIDAQTGGTLTLGKYLGRGEKVLLVLIRQFSCLLCRIHLKDLEAHKIALDACSVQVVVVSFGCREGALHWLAETGCQYDMVLDPHRKVYSAFGLRASLKKVLNFNNMLLYAEYVVANLEFPKGLPSIEDDMFQLGGDFVLDDQGRVLFSHCCDSPIDRPAVEDILKAL
ncbi:uncharacterized protein LOC110497568 isoform X3 [Oncorhynchus mykiss]|uniref:uncharacterized protein LOC110497568 isoform X3 n=1 Tax=Oncorhynchus mykiss TaxID=8022 RepID=UPI001878F640|nr:uncharacterized protein LOC110497568 isoform X3 [Oncorhynchus mykiss]